MSKTIQCFQYLSGPLVAHIGNRKTLACPSLQSPEQLFRVLFLPGLVVFATDNQGVAIATHIVIGIESIPIESQRHGILRHNSRDDVGSIRMLFGMDGDDV